VASTNRESAFEKLARIPHFHPAAVRLMTISTEAESSVEEFESVFQSDPVLTADLLVVANSAAFGFRRHVDTIKHALALLGVERVRGLAVDIMLAAYVHKQPAEQVRPIWFHSIATAVIAEKLGDLYGVGGMYGVGLLHDLGRVALLISHGQSYANLLASEAADVNNAMESETATCGLNHCDAGALLAGAWGFSEIMQLCMAGHHKSKGDDRGPGGYLGLAQMACWMADWIGYPEVKVRNPEAPPFAPARLSSSELEPNRLLDLIKQRTSMLVS
jgi:HD-like signal output (HDOD) protein